MPYAAAADLAVKAGTQAIGATGLVDGKSNSPRSDLGSVSIKRDIPGGVHTDSQVLPLIHGNHVVARGYSAAAVGIISHVITELATGPDAELDILRRPASIAKDHDILVQLGWINPCPGTEAVREVIHSRAGNRDTG